MTTISHDIRRRGCPGARAEPGSRRLRQVFVGRAEGPEGLQGRQRLYQAQDWKAAAEKYEDALASDPDHGEAYFFLGNSYDNVQAEPRGEPENDALHPEGDRELPVAAEKRPGPDDARSWRCSISSPPTAPTS